MSSSNLGVQVDYMGDIDGAIGIGVSRAAMTRCGQVRNSAMGTGVAARALWMYNMRIYDVSIVAILNPVAPVHFRLGAHILYRGNFLFLSLRFDSRLGANILYRDNFWIPVGPVRFPTGGANILYRENFDSCYHGSNLDRE